MLLVLLFYIGYCDPTCKTDGALTSGYTPKYEAHFAAYEATGDALFLFIGSSAGSTAFTYDSDTNRQLGHTMFLDVQGAGYSRITADTLDVEKISNYYKGAYESFESCLKFTHTKLFIVTGGIGAKIGVYLKETLNAEGLILIAPIIDIKSMMQTLPSVAFNMGLVDYQERMQLESYVISKSNPEYSDYLRIVNWVAKLSGDMQIHDYTKFGIDQSAVLLTNLMNSDQSRAKFSAQGMFFFTQNQDTYKLLEASLNEEVPVVSIEKYLVFIPQFSIAVNIPGSWHYWNRFLDKVPLTRATNAQGFSIYSIRGNVYTIQNSGDQVHLDQPDIFKSIIKSHYKL